MEKKLRRLFDYQKFQRNPRLDAIIADVESRYEGTISDDMLEFVSAAGEPGMMGKPMHRMGENTP